MKADNTGKAIAPQDRGFLLTCFLARRALGLNRTPTSAASYMTRTIRPGPPA